MYRFTFCPYCRPFKQPLHTHHGLWSRREGLILQLQDQGGQAGWGEVAPLPWFGSETLEEAISYCRQLPNLLSEEQIHVVPSTLPACQFGLGSAWEDLKGQHCELGRSGVVSQCSKMGLPLPPFPKREENGVIPQVSVDRTVTYCGLLPTGAAALKAWPALWQQGYRTLKWKIGVAPVESELVLFQALVRQLPAETKLRLDANGGLNWETAQQWLAVCEQYRASNEEDCSSLTIEYLEQPLPVEQFDAMLQLAKQSIAPLALDESVATLEQLHACLRQGWQGIFVVKPAICGYPQQLRHLCQIYDLDVVFSSVFETEVGRRTCLQLAQELSSQERAIGFGVKHWFKMSETEKMG